MIATLAGKLTEAAGGVVVVEVGGIGYGVRISLNDLSRLRIGSEAKFYIHEHIREDAHDLFGFIKSSTKVLFEQLLSVKNVGPKVALALLDVGTEDEVRIAIANGDVRFLQSAKGVGKRAAEQVVVELRDKVGLESSESAEQVVRRAGVSKMDEAALGLVALGYSEADALAVLSAIDADLPVEERIKMALKGKR